MARFPKTKFFIEQVSKLLENFTNILYFNYKKDFINVRNNGNLAYLNSKI